MMRLVRPWRRRYARWAPRGEDDLHRGQDVLAPGTSPTVGARGEHDEQEGLVVRDCKIGGVALPRSQDETRITWAALPCRVSPPSAPTYATSTLTADNRPLRAWRANRSFPRGQSQ